MRSLTDSEMDLVVGGAVISFNVVSALSLAAGSGQNSIVTANATSSTFMPAGLDGINYLNSFAASGLVLGGTQPTIVIT